MILLVGYILIALAAWWLIARWIWLAFTTYSADGFDLVVAIGLGLVMAAIWPIGLPVFGLAFAEPPIRTDKDWRALGDRLFRTGGKR